MTTERRITEQTERILETLLTDPTAEWWGTRIAPTAGLKSGSLYPALMRMERFGWLASRWEEVDPSEARRPRRRLYHLTAEGQRTAEEIVREAVVRQEKRKTKQQRWRRLPEGGIA